MDGAVSGWGRRRGARRVAPRHGFTFIEIMCSLIILIVGIYATFTLSLIAIQTDSEASHRATALAIAQREIELVRTKVWTSMPASGSIAGVSSLLPGGSGQLKIYQLEPSQLSAGTGLQTGLDEVIATVTWTESTNGADSITADTLVTENGIDAH